jgi:hypothetical protein
MKSNIFFVLACALMSQRAESTTYISLGSNKVPTNSKQVQSSDYNSQNIYDEVDNDFDPLANFNDNEIKPSLFSLRKSALSKNNHENFISSDDLDIFFKSNNLYPQQNTVSLLIEQPILNSRKCVSNDGLTGHAFVRVGLKNGDVYYAGLGLSDKDFTTQEKLKKFPDILTSKGSIFHTYSESWNIGKIYKISDSEVYKIFKYITEEHRGKLYHPTKWNCSTYAVKALESANINHNFKEHELDCDLQNLVNYIPKTLPFKKILLKVLFEINKYGYAPSDLAEDLKLEDSPYITKSLNGEIKEHNSKKITQKNIRPFKFTNSKISNKSNYQKNISKRHLASFQNLI